MATATKTTQVSNAQVSANQAAAAKLGVSIPGVGGGSKTASTNVSNAQVTANQTAAAKLGVSIPGVGGTQPKPTVPTPPGTTPGQPDPVPPEGTPVNPDSTGQVSYDQAVKNLNAGGLQGSTLAAAQSSLAGANGKNEFGQAHADLQAGGTTPTSNAGQNLAQVQSTRQTADSSVVPAMVAEHSGVQGILDNIAKTYNASSQTTTLMQDYKSLLKESGLDKINEQIIDADTIINGTEQEIRNEIQAAGGMGTDSQIQAMALSRNKSLLVKYNQLVQMKSDATTQLNTMMSLNAQDKQMAQTKVQNQISNMFSMANFQQQVDNNYREAYKWMGASALEAATANDPTQRGFAEKILGIPPGGLAAKAAEERNALSLDTQLKTAQIANINSEIHARNNPTPKAQTQAQVVAQGYAARAQSADQVINRLGSKFSNPLAIGGTTILGLGVPNALKSSDRKDYEQAQRQFINAVLRPESGASISPSEFESASKEYFPQAGDNSSQIQQKAQDRQLKIQSLYSQGATNQPVGAGDVIEYQGQQYHIDADGNMTSL